MNRDPYANFMIIVLIASSDPFYADPEPTFRLGAFPDPLNWRKYYIVKVRGKKKSDVSF